MSTIAKESRSVGEEHSSIKLEKPLRSSVSMPVVLAISASIVLGFALRINNVAKVGFAEDEINKLRAVQAYDHGDFSANAEHPMLMKVAIYLSVRGARIWHSLSGRRISDELALRFPNILFGSLTAIPLFLLTAIFFDRATGLWAAAFWSLGVNAITHNRIGKEDTLLVFFMLFAFYFFIKAKRVDSRQKKRMGRIRNLSAASFGLMLASKYFPHYFGLNMLYHHFYSMRQREPEEPRGKTPFNFFLIIALTFLLANPAILLPHVWEYLNAYSSEKLLTHSGYLMGNHLYRNTMSSSPFWGLPLYFYLLFLATKVPLTVLAAALVGFVLAARRWRHPGYGFVVFMLVFWLVPYSLIGAKWLRYTLSLMPFVYMSAAIGTIAMVRWMTHLLASLKISAAAPIAAALVTLAIMISPAWTAYAAGPHFALYTNLFGRNAAGYFFPHDEFYDEGLREAIEYIARVAPQKSTIMTEAPGVVETYLERFGRSDLQVGVLSDPKVVIQDQQSVFYILQRGRTYFENQNKMNEVKARLSLVYAGCIQGHTAAEVYVAASASIAAVQPCGDVRP